MKRIILAIVAVFAVQADVFSIDLTDRTGAVEERDATPATKKRVSAEKRARTQAARRDAWTTIRQLETASEARPARTARAQEARNARLREAMHDERVRGVLVIAEQADAANMNPLQRAVAFVQAHPTITVTAGTAAAVALAVISSYLMF